jgi:leukotriene-A4 hydrolase
MTRFARLPGRTSGLCLGLAVALAACACQRGTAGAGSTAATLEAPVTDATEAARDIHSFARPSDARVTHVALDLRANFTDKRLSGTATLTFERRPGATELVLDTRDLDIQRVADRAGATLPYSLADPDPILGRALTVTLPPQTNTIVVSYRTEPAAAALQWLARAQTAGKRLPYLYSQGEAILTRTWIPTQDSPGIRQTYEARITVPRDLRALMSAESLTPERVLAGDDRTFEFRLTQAVPPYLIALAVGDIQFDSLGTRSGVYTEPAVLKAAAFEFADLEQMVKTAESLLGPYRWGRYDLLVLPPSFPFGGMENPRLTFATPTVIAGDRSLVSLVAHELAHSWSGNLVTNATWSDFWLNEGVTTYVERRIMEALYGSDRARILEVLAWRELQDEIKRLGGPSSPDTVLHIDLKGRDPDDGATQIPYEKGAALLRLIELTVGRPAFDAYLRSYVDRHAFQSITTAAFLADVRAHLVRGDSALEAKLQLDDWAYKPGLPANAVEPRSEALERVRADAAAFAAGAPASSLKAKASGWSTQEWQYFLGNLPDTLSPMQLADLDKMFALTQTGNSEILFAWLRIAIRHHYEPAMPALERFLTTQGRRKFLRPLYEDLNAQRWGKAEARRIYARARPLYHSVATSTLDPILR